MEFGKMFWTSISETKFGMRVLVSRAEDNFGELQKKKKKKEVR